MQVDHVLKRVKKGEIPWYCASLIALTIILPGCGGRDTVHEFARPLSDGKNYVFRVQDDIKERFAEFEARSFDIPFPLATEPMRLTTGQGEAAGNVIIVYTTTQSLEDMMLFYTQEMERLGWKCTLAVTDDEQTMVTFEKPRKACGIALSRVVQSDPMTHVVVGYGPKHVDDHHDTKGHRGS